ncbi:MAG: SH3 domain-containing protein [Deltaproteobacteria bacterium]|nr:MAG: SH3 domain-containing protein [Deltaproteobacteria bacterium]
MTIPSAFCNCRVYLPLVLVISVCFITACLKQPPRETDMPADARYEKLQGEHKRLQKALTNSNADRKALKDRIAKIQLNVLEKDAQIKELEQRLISQQEMLDEAVQEVVRAKAKLRTLESKAEAASNMAEAEIAIKALKAELGAGKKDPDVIKAEQLLKMSAREFKKENYGGTLYLTSQAKGHIEAGQMRLRGREETPTFKGEVLFAQPLPLRVLKTSNLRERPDRNSKVLTTLEKGTTVVGYSYMGEWVRVHTEEGTYGWIYQTLVVGR